MKNIEVILNIPSPYRLHLLAELSRQAKQRGFSFCAHFMAKGHEERPKTWLNPQISFNHSYHRDFGFKAHHFNPGLILSLLCKNVDILLVGSPFDTFTGICAALFLRAKMKVCWVEGNTKTTGKMGGFLGWFKRLILSKFDFVAVPGKDGANYIECHRRLTRRKLPRAVLLPNLIDETRFKPREEWPSEVIAECRSMMHANEDDKICLVPARLSQEKGLVPFIDALNVEWLDGWRIIIMGRGGLRDMSLAHAEMKQILDKIMILDYVPYDAMPAFYAASDLFMLPSLCDRNPLTVPEALHSGLPVALSNQIGNVEEGVVDGVNGWVLPVLDRELFQKKLQGIFSSSMTTLREFGAVSQTVNSRFWETKPAVSRFLDSITI